MGGNALGGGRRAATVETERAAARSAAKHIATLVADGCRLVVTHGNGPQVGHALRRSELAAGELPPVPMDVAVAQTQGSIGYLLARALADALAALGHDVPVTPVVTEVVVDPDDPAFDRPEKPIGPYFSAAEASASTAERGWVVRDFGTPGWRRVVASPRPLAILQLEAVRMLTGAGTVAVAVGGGGIPVAMRGGTLVGVEAVVDKDLSSGLLARELGADALIIATDVARVTLRYGTPAERPLDRLTVQEAREYLAAGEFPAGSMGPKVEAIADFVEAGGRVGVITSLERIVDAWHGRAGTRIEAV